MSLHARSIGLQGAPVSTGEIELVPPTQDKSPMSLEGEHRSREDEQLNQEIRAAVYMEFRDPSLRGIVEAAAKAERVTVPDILGHIGVAIKELCMGKNVMFTDYRQKAREQIQRLIPGF